MTDNKTKTQIQDDDSDFDDLLDGKFLSLLRKKRKERKARSWQ